jgi:hypothetical protein
MRRKRSQFKTTAVGAVAAGAHAVGALAVGAFAVGVLALGTLAIGRLSAQHVTIGKSRLRSLHIDELTVGSAASR